MQNHFNPDPNKQSTEVIFSRKIKPVNLPIFILFFNKAPVATAPFQTNFLSFIDE